MPSRLASGANTSRASSATSAGTGCLLAANQRRVCRREARRSSTTRRSRLKASSILRTRSICWRCWVASSNCAPRAGALHAHQLARVLDQLRVAFTEALGDQLLGLREVLAGVHQVGSGLDGGRGAYAGQDGRHAVGMRQGVLAGVEALAAQQRFRERARTIEHVERLRRPRRGSGQRARQIAFEQLDDGSALGFGGGGFQVRGGSFSARLERRVKTPRI
jgi:hypothetical protein